MKKIIIFLLLVIGASAILSSCRSQEQCAAYGEARKFQVEHRR
jgi:hypothetical protein